MNLAELQAELRHFAAERDWQSFHTPKNLTTALMVEAAELAEIFQWMTPEESKDAHRDPVSKQRIGEEVADVLPASASVHPVEGNHSLDRSAEEVARSALQGLQGAARGFGSP